MPGCTPPYNPPITYVPWKPPESSAPAPTPSTEVKREELSFDRQTMIPLSYGRNKIDAKAIPVGVVGNKIYVAYIFCEGPVGGYDEYLIDDNPASEYTGLYGFTPYLGELDQPVDPGMAAVNPEWTDNLAGTAWVSAWFLADEKFTGIPSLSAWGRWKKVNDFRGSRAEVYTTNPVLCLVDLLQSKRYGGGVIDSRIDFPSAIAAANICDELVNGEKRFELNYLIRNPTTIGRIKRFMLQHFCGELNYSEGVYKFFVHAPRPSLTAYTEKDVTNLTLQRPKKAEVYNQVRAVYFREDTGQEDEITVETDAVSLGEEQLATANLDLSGCALFSQVNRVCVFELNKTTSDLRVVFETHDTRGLEQFDRFTLSHSFFGLVDSDFYVLEIVGSKITAKEYDESAFSDEVKSYDPLPEADLPLPFDKPEQPTNLSLVEHPLQAIDSTYSSYVACTWHPSPSPWVNEYEVSYKSDDLVDFVVYAVTDDTEVALWTTSRESNLVVRIRALNKWGQKSDYISDSVYIQGKSWAPVWPTGAGLRAELAAGAVMFFWDAAIDSDVSRYELRRGDPGDTWEESQLIAKIDSLSYLDPQCPQGTWQYMLKAFDRSKGSSTALSVEIEMVVSPDLGFSNVTRLELTGAANENIFVYPGNTANDVAVPALGAGATWTDRFNGGPAWDDTPGLRWVTVPTDPTLMWLETDSVDLGFSMTADFKMTHKRELFGSGAGASLAAYYYLSEDGANWTQYDHDQEVSATARYTKARFEWGITDQSTFWVVGEPVTIHSSAMPLIDYGTVDVDASGEATITFAISFNAIDRVKTEPMGATPFSVMSDALTLTSMVIRTFDPTTGNPVAGRVNWEVKGV